MYEPFDRALSKLWASGAAECGDEWVGKVKDAISALTLGYMSLGTAHEPIDYKSLPVQVAYLFKYAPSRASFIRDTLIEFEAKTEDTLLPVEGAIRVALVGGGPGSEIPGVLDFLDSSGSYGDVSDVHFQIFDREPAWKTIHSVLLPSLETQFEVTVGFTSFDACDDNVPEQQLIGFDLVIMSYFISEIACLQDSEAVKMNLAKLIGTMNSDAYLVYNDNKHLKFYSFMNKVRSKSPLKELHEFEDSSSIPFPYTRPFVTIRNAIDHCPHLNGPRLAKLLF